MFHTATVLPCPLSLSLSVFCFLLDDWPLLHSGSDYAVGKILNEKEWFGVDNVFIVKKLNYVRVDLI